MSREHAEAIRVYCDDPRHARGKVAEVASIQPIEHDGEWLWVAAAGMVRGRRIHNPRTRRNVAVPGREPGSLTHAFPCPLCPRRPAFTDEQLQTFADGWSGEGYTSVSLTVLDAHAASM